MLLMLFDNRECCEGRNICRTQLKHTHFGRESQKIRRAQSKHPI